MRIKSRLVDAVIEDVRAIEQRIAGRARQIFQDRGAAGGDALQDWLNAERETIWRPALEVVRTADAFVIEAAVAGLDPKRLDLRVTPAELLLAADVRHAARDQEGEVLLSEFATGPLFRTYRFPDPVDPARVTAECRNGLLRVVAPLARSAGKVHVQAA